MDSPTSLVLGKEGCTFHDVVNVFFYEEDSAVLENWTNFAIELDMTSNVIEDLRQKTVLKQLKVKEVICKILQSWKAMKGNHATLPNLLKHLRTVKFDNVANKLRERFLTENWVHEEQSFKPKTMNTSMMDSMDSLVLGEKNCTFKDVVNVLSNEENFSDVFITWEILAKQLGIEPFLILEWRQDTEMKRLTAKDVLYKILESWKSKYGWEATLQNLLEHLEKVNLKHAADDLKKFWSPITSPPLHEGVQIFMPTLPNKPNFDTPRTLESVMDVKGLTYQTSNSVVPATSSPVQVTTYRTMDKTLVVGEKDCAVKDVVEAFFNEGNCGTFFKTWREFARELGISSYQIEEWNLDRNRGILTMKDILYKILESWKMKWNEATLPNLLKHLENVKLENVADDLRKLFSTVNPEHKGRGQLYESTLSEKPNCD